MSTTTPFNLVILAYPGMTMLDAIGPNEVLGNSPYFNVTWVSIEHSAITNDQNSFSMGELIHFSEIEHCDILLVPGGAGDHYVMQREDVLAWVRTIDETSLLTTSVCTGALILGKAGVLKGHKACTHWACLDELKALGALPQRKRFVESGKYVSSSGVSAGIDMALYLLKKLVSKKHSQDIRFAIEYFPNQFKVVNSYTLPRLILSKLASRFHAVFKHARDKVVQENDKG